MTTKHYQDNLRKCLMADTRRGADWYGVIDAAQDERSPSRAEEGGLQVRSLYTGRLGQLAAPAAPFLITFSFDSSFADWLLAHWNGHHGILLQARTSFDGVWKHLRHFLLVKDEVGKKYRFRFYDPRVLRAFIPSCSYEELQGFFGPVDCYYAADRPGGSAMVYERRPDGIAVRELSPTANI